MSIAVAKKTEGSADAIVSRLRKGVNRTGISRDLRTGQGSKGLPRSRGALTIAASISDPSTTRRATYADRDRSTRKNPRRLHRHRRDGPVDVPAHHERWLRHDRLDAYEVKSPAAAG